MLVAELQAGDEREQTHMTLSSVSEPDVSTEKFLRGKYAICGVGETTYRRGSNETTRALGTWAVKNAMDDAGMTADDIDLFEINEAFAAQVLPSAEEVGIDLDKLNVNGGAIALGHPFGMTGARIMTTLLNGLEDSDKEFGVESMCVGGGQGMAMVVQRLS